MTIKELIQQINQEFTALRTKILTKLAHKDQQIKQKDTAIQKEKDSKQETVRQLETTLKENATNEQVLEKLLTEFKSLAQALDQDA